MQVQAYGGTVMQVSSDMDLVNL